MTPSRMRHIFSVLLVLFSVGLFGFLPVSGCLSNPTPHPGIEPGHSTNDDTDRADTGQLSGEDNGMGGADGSDASAAPPCAPGEGGDAYLGDAVDAIGGDAYAGDIGPVDGGGVIGWAADCGPADPGEGAEDDAAGQDADTAAAEAR